MPGVVVRRFTVAQPDLIHVLSAHESGWTQIAVLGQFRDPRSITPEMAESWIHNLSAAHRDRL